MKGVCLRFLTCQHEEHHHIDHSDTIVKNVDTTVESSEAREGIGKPWRPRRKPEDIIIWRDGEEKMN